MTGFRWEIIEEYGPLFVDGALMTIKCTIICVILGTLWGLTLGLGRMAGHAVVENHAQGDPATGVSPYSAAAGQ